MWIREMCSKCSSMYETGEIYYFLSCKLMVKIHFSRQLMPSAPATAVNSLGGGRSELWITIPQRPSAYCETEQTSTCKVTWLSSKAYPSKQIVSEAIIKVGAS